MQHLVLNKVQCLLEECAFDFAMEWIPSLLQKFQWDCPEAIELNKWTYAMMKRWDSLPAAAFVKDAELPSNSILLSVNKLRHSAVHRLRTSAKGVIEMIQSAVKFARLLRDTLRESQIEELHRELEAKVKALELNKNFLENILAQELQEIVEQRAQLDQRERDAISTMVKEDDEYKLLIGSRLEQYVQDVLTKDTQPLVKPDTKVETESDDESNNKDEPILDPEPSLEQSSTRRENTSYAAPAVVLEALPEEPIEEDTRDFEWSSTPEPASLSERHIAEDDHAPIDIPPAPTPPIPEIIAMEQRGTLTPEIPSGPPLSESPPMSDAPPHAYRYDAATIQERLEASPPELTYNQPVVQEASDEGLQTEYAIPSEQKPLPPPSPPNQDRTESSERTSNPLPVLSYKEKRFVLPCSQK